ncbi:hypothetical protein O7599_09395 [Streptomyces sp. WMMC500]|uniref:hypothetical protein n=1 Tax=Streptomyces sp. WMMC500 TaxID=3015154 RepID=UPI00248D26F9|nr:hypothetical protein [Streptomyces sp. WMMC500]WBB62722.1 hypothetical protein O7599_09395 [Streptomyces sp. WMMC500]
MRIKGLPARRTVLAGAAVLAATGTTAGCSGDGDDGDADSARTERLRRRAAEESRGLLRRYDATAAAHPGLAGALDPLRTEVAQHVSALARGLPADTRAASPGPEAEGSGDRADAAPPPAGKRGGEAVPADPAEAVAALVAAEKRAADAHNATLATAPGEFAGLLASVAAAGAAHVYLLGAMA